MTHDLHALTAQYVAAFDAADPDAAGALMAEEFSLTDPGVTNLTPKARVLDFIRGIFENAGGDLSFEAHNILADGSMSVIEFTLRLGDQSFDGVDLIDWKDGKMVAMRAHLTPRG